MILRGGGGLGCGGDRVSALLGGLVFFFISVARGKQRISLQLIQEKRAAVSLQHTGRYFVGCEELKYFVSVL